MGRRKAIEWDSSGNAVVTAYLVVKSTGNVRVTQTPPRLLAKEIAVKMNFSLNRELFSMPLPEANMTLKKEGIIEPSVEVRMKYAMSKL